MNPSNNKQIVIVARLYFTIFISNYGNPKNPNKILIDYSVVKISLCLAVYGLGGEPAGLEEDVGVVGAELDDQRPVRATRL